MCAHFLLVDRVKHVWTGLPRTFCSAQNMVLILTDHREDVVCTHGLGRPLGDEILFHLFSFCPQALSSDNCT